jgi:adenosylmethionine-8-amino-7-oxononanoate aminotransferase
VRRCGFVAGIEMADAETAGEVCRQARDHGLLTRNIRETISLLPPLCTTDEQLQRTVAALTEAIREAAEGRASARPGRAEARPSQAAANPSELARS